jgi:hypothetical protein
VSNFFIIFCDFKPKIQKIQFFPYIIKSSQHKEIILKKLLLFFVFLSISIQATCTKIDDRYYYGIGLRKGESACYSYKIKSGKFPVFTLKQDGFSNADFDIYIYDYSDFSSLLKKGIKNGSKTELITLTPQNSLNYVYIKIKNEGRAYGKYKFYTHSIDIKDKIAETLVKSVIQSGIELVIKEAFDIKSTSSNTSKRNVTRTSTAIISYLSNKNFADTSVDLMINEVTTTIREIFGYGFLGKLFVNFSISVVRDVYRYY